MNIYMNILYIYLCKQIYFIFIYHIFISPLWSTCLRRASLHWFAHFRSANLYCCAHIALYICYKHVRSKREDGQP